MDDQPRSEPPRGIFDSLRALIATVLAIVHNRAELLTTELEEELTRLIGVVVWALVAVFAVIIGATFLGVTALLAVPETYRAWTAAGLGVAFLLVAAAGGLFIRRILRSKPRPFDATLRELEKDREHLRGKR